jgi:hypothetical protein
MSDCESDDSAAGEDFNEFGGFLRPAFQPLFDCWHKPRFAARVSEGTKLLNGGHINDSIAALRFRIEQ